MWKKVAVAFKLTFRCIDGVLVLIILIHVSISIVDFKICWCSSLPIVMYLINYANSFLIKNEWDRAAGTAHFSLLAEIKIIMLSLVIRSPTVCWNFYMHNLCSITRWSVFAFLWGRVDPKDSIWHENVSWFGLQLDT